MRQEDKELLLRDLSARIPYDVRVYVKFYGDYNDDIEEYTFVLNEIDTKYPNYWFWLGGKQLQESGKFTNGTYSFSVSMEDVDQEIKPYLRSMSKMTDAEKKDYDSMQAWKSFDWEMVDWYNKHHFDYRGLIKKGLALEAPEGMYGGEILSVKINGEELKD